MDNSTFVQYTLSVLVRRIDALLLVVITVVGLIGNAMVCLAFVVSHKIRTKTNIFVVNLALADFLTCATMPVFIWSLLVDTESDAEVVDMPCEVVLLLTQTFIGCSILTLALIAVNRWMLVASTREVYNKYCRYRFVFPALILSWTFPLLVSVTPIAFGVGEVGYDRWSCNCALLRDHPYSYTYKIILLSCLMPFPMVVIIYCYFSIYKHVKSHNTKIQQLQTDISRTISGVPLPADRNGSDVNIGLRKRCFSQKQLEITTNLFHVVVAFYVCLTPYMLAEFSKARAIVVNQTKILTVLNSCINPFLYAVNHPHFKRVFGSIALRRWMDL